MRRVYIIPKEMKAEDAYEEADRLGIGEICHGIPPKLRKIIKEEDLPFVYEEPEITENFRDILKELDELKDKVKKLEGKGENNADR